MCLTAIRILLYLRGNLEGFEKIPIWMILLLVDKARNTLVPSEKVDPDKEKELSSVDVLLLRCLQSENLFYLVFAIPEVLYHDQRCSETLSNPAFDGGQVITKANSFEVF